MDQKQIVVGVLHQSDDVSKLHNWGLIEVPKLRLKSLFKLFGVYVRPKIFEPYYAKLCKYLFLCKRFKTEMKSIHIRHSTSFRTAFEFKKIMSNCNAISEVFKPYTRTPIVGALCIIPIAELHAAAACDSGKYEYAASGVPSSTVNLELLIGEAVPEDLRSNAADKIGSLWMALDFSSSSGSSLLLPAICTQNGNIICEFVVAEDLMNTEDVSSLHGYDVIFANLETDNVRLVSANNLHPLLVGKPQSPEYIFLDDGFVPLFSQAGFVDDFSALVNWQFKGCEE